ncbi:RICIN domain-containing protein [Paractinoplanes atraurantiacus]|uniref:Ricin-type beta-trefoil lectin domain-containing protein n=1 Tax=Paractinoplanes atraurantiacus TaxID=1036182 RepID=A0A285IXD9_9ACTN|nr:RICIN domain-containing protein [Actinoplanes atraurantiacus]SNY51581.1 Ricin-type beta-trefoil lectin domain-containing protein [Actinoplanes atraurantiacus]
MSLLRRVLVALLAAAAVLVVPTAAAAAAPFKVLAFYNGTWDAAHIDFDKEAREWFPQAAAQNGFTWEATTDWSRLSATGLAGYKVIMFLDDAPPADRRAAFQQYMQNGGAWLGFHVSAFTTDANSWSWYYNTFLGSGNFATNTWGPTAETLRIDDRTHPTTSTLPATIPSAVSEWYSWSRDLRQNPDIDILASIDASSFPVGTDPNQQWRSGYYPLIWSNRNYKMIYTNFGHNGMNYETNTRTSSTFASPQQNQWLINSILWLAGESGGGEPPAEQPIDPAGWYPVVNKNSAKCVDARSAGTVNGTAIQQYACNTSTAQQYQFTPTSGGYVRIANRGNTAQVLDVTDVSTADNARIQTWLYGGGANQQWQPVSEGGGYYHFVNRNSGKCLDVPAASQADSVQLVQYACNGTAAQSFRLTR